MPKEVRQIGSFTARDNNGGEHIIDVYADIIDVSTFGKPGREAMGLKQLRTADGRPVNRLAKGKYEIVSTGEILISDEPGAP